jgi:phosphohistidine phosphatase
MKTLYIVRHAKSDWEIEGIADYERPLSGKGIKDAHHKTALLTEKEKGVDLIISSHAFRALNTAVIFAKLLDLPFNKISISEAIYGSDEMELLKLIQKIDDKYSSVMLFGHNPEFTELSRLIALSEFEKIPTSGIVCIECDVQSWKNIAPGKGNVRFYDFSKAKS